MNFGINGEQDKQDRRIQEVIIDVENDDMLLFETWRKYIEEHISFPFESEVFEAQHPASFIKQGDILKVIKIESVEDLYGIIVEVKRKRERCYIPLCDLEGLNMDKKQYQILRDYSVWFANR